MLPKRWTPWLIGFAVGWPLLCLWWAVNVTSDYWLFFLGALGPIVALCTKRPWKLLVFVLDFLMWLIAEPNKEREGRMEETVTMTRAEIVELGHSLHNMWSRNVAACIGLASLIALWLAPGSMEFGIGSVGAVGIVLAVYWPFIVRELRQQMAAKAEG